MLGSRLSGISLILLSACGDTTGAQVIVDLGPSNAGVELGNIVVRARSTSRQAAVCLQADGSARERRAEACSQNLAPLSDWRGLGSRRINFLFPDDEELRVDAWAELGSEVPFSATGTVLPSGDFPELRLTLAPQTVCSGAGVCVDGGF